MQFNCTRSWFIYALIDPRNARVRYIGWTINIDQRLRDHFKPSQLQKTTHKARWLSELSKSGLRPICQILECGISDRWAEAERYWISEFLQHGSPLTNCTDGGDGTPGWKPSNELKERWSKTRKGRAPHPNAAAKTIELFKGKPRPKQYTQPMHDAIRGKAKTAEHKQKISEAKKGKSLNFTAAHRQFLRDRMRSVQLLSHTPEVVARQAASKHGKPLRITEEDRQRRRDRMKSLRAKCLK